MRAQAPYATFESLSSRCDFHFEAKRKPMCSTSSERRHRHVDRDSPVVGGGSISCGARGRRSRVGSGGTALSQRQRRDSTAGRTTDDGEKSVHKIRRQGGRDRQSVSSRSPRAPHRLDEMQLWKVLKWAGDWTLNSTVTESYSQSEPWGEPLLNGPRRIRCPPSPAGSSQSRRRSGWPRRSQRQ